tara:strand:+ start:4033 stop:4830 length:798 start_codon:yes stop_codon:yes gene_type:complete
LGLREYWHKLGSPRWFYQIAGGWITGFGIGAVLLLGIGLIWGLAFAPPDYQQGHSFRIMYVHVPAAMVAQSLYLGMGVAGFVGLVWRMKLADVAIGAALPLGMALTAVALFTGSLWGKPTWGSWWEWDGRTVSTTLLLFLYIGIYALREALSQTDLRARASALICLVGTINIPIIKYSVNWWQTLHQPASFTLTEKPAMPAEMWLPLLVTVLGLYCFAGHNVMTRMRGEILLRESRSNWVIGLFGGPDATEAKPATAQALTGRNR